MLFGVCVGLGFIFSRSIVIVFDHVSNKYADSTDHVKCISMLFMKMVRRLHHSLYSHTASDTKGVKLHFSFFILLC